MKVIGLRAVHQYDHMRCAIEIYGVNRVLERVTGRQASRGSQSREVKLDVLDKSIKDRQFKLRCLLLLLRMTDRLLNISVAQRFPAIITP